MREIDGGTDSEDGLKWTLSVFLDWLYLIYINFTGEMNMRLKTTNIVT